MKEEVIDDFEEQEKPKPKSRFKRIMDVSFRLIFILVFIGFTLRLLDQTNGDRLLYLCSVLGILWIIVEFIRKRLKK